MEITFCKCLLLCILISALPSRRCLLACLVREHHVHAESARGRYLFLRKYESAGRSRGTRMKEDEDLELASLVGKRTTYIS